MKLRNILVVLSIISVITYSVWVIFFRYDPILENYSSSLGISLLQLLIASISLSITLQKQIDIRLRRGWFFLGLAALSNLIAECLWYYFETILGVSPFPSLADFFYLLFYPLTLIGVLFLPFKPLKRLEFLIYLFDICIVMVTVVMFFWNFILAPIHLSSAGGWKGIISIAYPIGDLLLFAAVTALIQRNTEEISRSTSIYIAASLLITAVPDSFFAYYEVNNIPYSIAYLNVFWLISALCMLLAVQKQMRMVYGNSFHLINLSVRSERLLRTTLPYFAIITGPTFLYGVVNSSYAAGLQLQGILIGTIILIALVLGRQHIVIMENMYLYEETHKLAITDSLTGLYNRHYFNEVFQKEIERARRYKNLFSILLIDVDNFKVINDNFGHLKGDVVLKIIAGSLTEQIRETDILARFGGDEFVIILPETDINGAFAAAEKIEQNVSKHIFANITLNVSIGAASFNYTLSAEQLLEEVDRQLYKDKKGKYLEKNFSASDLFS